jgi:hypothetical protein
MRSTRHATALLAVAAVATTAGCGFILGTDALTATASQATVPDAVQAETGYDRENVSEVTVEQTPSVAGQERTVRATNYVATYEKTVSVAGLAERRAAVFAALSTPAFEIADQTFNPVEDMTTRELLGQARSQYEGISVGDRVGSRNVTMLGETVRVDKYEGTATIAGTEVDVYLHVTTPVEDGSDFVVGFAIHPQRLEETDAVDRLLGSVEHGG